jgi:alpha-tubulin suppressor-like RCC1 family protein
MPKDDINYRFTEGGVVYDFYDVFVPGDYFRQPSLFNWGRNGYSQLGIGIGGGTRNTPVTTFLGRTNWKQVSAGYNYTMAIKTDGTLWGWGASGSGQLGINDTNRRCTAVTTFAGGTNWKQVSSCFGNNTLVHTVAIKTDGTLWIWGSNSDGKLGDNTVITRSTPVTTFTGGTNWKQVSCAGYHTAAIKTDGTLWTWGRGSDGRLGHNSTLSRSTPITTFIGGNNWKQVSAGYNHTTAIKSDGTLWTWGGNSDGQLGNNTATQRLTPVTTFTGGTNWKQVSAGLVNVAAIKSDGTLWTWGRNLTGQLGNNAPTGQRCTPVTTFAGGTNWKQVSCGFEHMTAVKTDGTLWVWGQNQDGQLGNESVLIDANTPITTFAGGNNWKQVSAGDFHTAAITYTPDP